ncbi:sensor domain-containing diguanylate cyclase [Lichenibacterium dinghuense]|uniref:sensor domain-containing diguanylate cyclase n=1 Tax=Lichenibacterium dinghuense TaxID=2895977 RepID=UPI001F002CFA|nr:diguanylate cyclase [Lichenibacterium sp. 6Y81]
MTAATRRRSDLAPGAGRGALPALTALVLLAICLVFTFVMAAWHRDVGRVLSASGDSIAAAVAGEVDRNIELLDFSLQGVAEQWDVPDVQALPPRLRDTVLFDGAMRAPGFGMMMVLDRDGRLVARSVDVGELGASFADRDYFRVHVGNDDVGLYVSKPFRSRVSDAWVVALSRRIDDDDAFAGVAVGTLDVAYLTKLYAGLHVGDGSAVTLFRTDGTVITRAPLDEGDVGMFAGGGDSFNRMRAARDGTFEGASPVDGLPRVISFHRVGDLPLIQAVEVAGEGPYSAWWRRAAAIAGLLTLLCFGVLGLSLALARELGRRAAAEAELRRLASTDALTGLANRRRFDAALPEEWARAAASREPLAVLMVDADSFKAYNDLFGHPAGDLVLQAIAARLDEGARRRGGLAGRWGGEEFAVTIPGCDEARALRVAEDLRAAVEGLALPHPSGVGGVVTISVGVAAARPAAGGAARDVLADADVALYRAKAEGRNRCRARASAEVRAA